MKKIFIFLLITSINSCSSQKNSYNLNMEISKYNSEPKKIDVLTLPQISTKFKKNKETFPRELNFLYKKNNLLLQRTGSMSYRHEERDKIDNTITLELEVDLRNSVIRTREKIDKLFDLVEWYYVNGNIRLKGITSWLGFSINKGYEYSSEGDLIEVKDYDEGYEFNYEKVLEFCEKNKINLLNKEGVFSSTVNKVTLKDGKKVWNISFHNEETNKIDSYQIDAENGKLMKELKGTNLPRFRHGLGH